MYHPPHPGLLTIPYEIHLHVFSHLGPQDLVQLSMTCRFLRDMMFERRIWEDAVRSMCRQNALFEPSYPVQAMSLSELQNAAFGPKRWHDLPEKTSAGSRILSRAESAVRPPTTIPIQEYEDFERAYIIPGGRYLLTMTCAQITFWDLGVAVQLKDADRHSRLLHAFRLERGRSLSMSCPYALTESHLRFLVLGVDVDQNWLRVYEVGPLPQSTTIRHLAELRIEPEYSRLNRYWMDKELVFLEIDNTLIAWDFSRSLCCSWTLFGKTMAFLSNGDLVIAITATGLSAWKIPSLHPIDGTITTSTNFADVQPSFQVAYDKQTRPCFHGPCVSILSRWYSDPDLPLVYDVYGSVAINAPRTSASRFQISLAGDRKSATITLVSTSTFPRCYPEPHIRPYMTCSRSLTTLNVVTGAPGRAVLSLFPMVQSGESVTSWKHVLLEPLAHAPLAISFCPCSGRLVYICDTSHGNDGLNAVHVVNLFPLI